MADIFGQLFALNKASNKSVALYHKFALSVGLSDSSLGVLYALLCKDNSSQYELCSQWSIAKQTVNTTVSALKKKGFVTLTPVSGARNKKSITLTVAGREFAQKTVGVLLETERSAFIELSENEREQYIELNEKYNKALIKKLSGHLGNQAQA